MLNKHEVRVGVSIVSFRVSVRMSGHQTNCIALHTYFCISETVNVPSFRLHRAMIMLECSHLNILSKVDLIKGGVARGQLLPGRPSDVVP
jgi:hypothetical protein